jgi:hypothetical protein
MSRFPGAADHPPIKQSDLDIPPPPRPVDKLRSVSLQLTEALVGGGAFDRAGYDGRRLLREVAAELLKIAAEVEHSATPPHGRRSASLHDESRHGDDPQASYVTARAGLIVIK